MATIRKRRSKFQVQIRHLGTQPITRSFLLRKDAEAWARQIEILADQHELPTDRKVLKHVTLGELVARYRDTVSIRKKGHHVERVVLNAFLLHPICRKRLSELSGKDFAAYRDERLREIKPASVKRQLGPIRHLFEIARDEWGLPIRENPLAKVKLSGADRRRERRLRDGELDRLLDAARKCRNPLIAPIIRFALETGMRRGEILSTRADAVDLKNRCLLIQDAKNGQERTIPLSKAAVTLLRSSMGEGGRAHVFPISANAFRLAWERTVRRAGIDDLHFHDLRHEAISRFFEKGLAVPEVALISGHKDMRMLFRYTHPIREQVLLKLDTTKSTQSFRL